MAQLKLTPTTKSDQSDQPVVWIWLIASVDAAMMSHPFQKCHAQSKSLFSWTLPPVSKNTGEVWKALPPQWLKNSTTNTKATSELVLSLTSSWSIANILRIFKITNYKIINQQKPNFKIFLNLKHNKAISQLDFIPLKPKLSPLLKMSTTNKQTAEKKLTKYFFSSNH